MKIGNPIYKKPMARLLLIILLQLIMFTIYGTYKAGYHVDEEWSYGFANSTNGAHFYSGKINDVDNEKYNNWMAGSEFHEYVTVQPGEGFSYGEVFQNQVQDISPPLYTFLLHTICSFFPDTLNKWFGISLNMVLFVFCQIYFFLLARESLKSDRLAVLACMFWGFSMGVVNSTLFTRMYTLFTLLVLITTWLHINPHSAAMRQHKNVLKKRLFWYNTDGVQVHYRAR